ncbi:hypothetical protein [Luteimonas panaciterrae]|uniref:hypothetical protein n=1 Tax=Luteimonas panaciterrae TaxID=363885 RepID=UPI001CFB84C6|nr:hypothetical protein [Luteimonas panaciterrae]
MKIGMHKFVGLGVVALALAMGTAGSASASAGTTYCYYQGEDGSQWIDRYAGRRACPLSDVNNGVVGELYDQEYIA